MKPLIKEIRLYLFVKILSIATCVLPKDSVKTWKWISEMPFE
jgi:hypothetical protein